jgi:AraC-like DNA-binding protein
VSASPAHDCGLIASLTTPSFDVGLFRLSPGFDAPRHRHDAPGLVVGVAGAFELSGGLERRRGAVGPEEAALLPDGLPHRERSVRGCLCVLARARRADDAGTALASPLTSLGIFAARGLLGARLLAEMTRGDDLAPLVVESLLRETIGATRRASGERRMAPRVARAVERLEESFVAPPSLFELARDSGVSPGHFSRSFRRATGCTVPEYARRVRVRRAARLLRASSAPLADVAAACGFADQSHLTRQFHLESGFTPAAYRRAARSGPAGVSPA